MSWTVTVGPGTVALLSENPDWNCTLLGATCAALSSFLNFCVCPRFVKQVLHLPQYVLGKPEPIKRGIPHVHYVRQNSCVVFLSNILSSVLTLIRVDTNAFYAFLLVHINFIKHWPEIQYLN